MSIALKFGDLEDPTQLSGVIYLDATTNYEREFNGKVSSHPIEAGVSITDHFTSDNPRIRVAGVISGADLSAIPSNLLIEGTPPLNNNEQPDAVTVTNLPSKLRKLIPDTVGQWIPDMKPVVVQGPQSRTDYKEEVEALLEEVMAGVFFNEKTKRWQNRMTLITLYETISSFTGRSIPNLVLTNHKVREDVETGDGLFLELTLEQVRFATVESAEAPAPKKGTTTDKAAAKTADKGPVTATNGAPDPVIDHSLTVQPGLGKVVGVP